MNITGIVKNPLSVIALFASIAETSGVAILPFVESENQVLFIWFLMLFPFALIILFFATLNYNHKVLYAPSDYKNDKSFLEGIHRSRSLKEDMVKMEKTIEAKVQEVLDSNESNQAPESKQHIAQKITDSIKTSTSVAVDISPITGHKQDVFYLPCVAFPSFDRLLDEIYVLIEEYANPFEYGQSWVIKNHQGTVIKNSRMITGESAGFPMSDRRSLKEVGISAGMRVSVERP